MVGVVGGVGLFWNCSGVGLFIAGWVWIQYGCNWEIVFSKLKYSMRFLQDIHPFSISVPCYCIVVNKSGVPR